MSRYQMEDGTVIDTDNATQSWEEERDWDGNNHIGRLSGSQWQGSRDHAEWLSPEAAARWLLANEDTLPDDLAHLEVEILE